LQFLQHILQTSATLHRIEISLDSQRPRSQEGTERADDLPPVMMMIERREAQR
jgi:molybdenum cofactor biosynthesis enzyme MoaA